MEATMRTWAEVNIDAIVANCRLTRQISGKNICAVVKADGYGHGAVAVAKALYGTNSAESFAVSNYDEAAQLREAGITCPILILGYTPVKLAPMLYQNDITQSVYSLAYARALGAEAVAAGVRVKAHLKLDTGMGRIGFDCRTDALRGLEEAREALQCPGLKFEGVFTHFAVADSDAGENRSFTRQQRRRFFQAVNTLESEGAVFAKKHCCNSAAGLDAGADGSDLVRAGIILYGLTPDPTFRLPKGFTPAMSLYSVVSQVKYMEPGESVGYGRTCRMPSRRKIATVSAGYADGVPRLLSNRGRVMIGGQSAPIVGRICMDQFCVDVTQIENVAIGDRVTIFGEGIPLEEVAEMAQTINYEIVCGITKRVPRVYTRANGDHLGGTV